MQFVDTVAYSHLPSGTIRLLRFHEDLTSDHVGHLEVFTLDQVPPYYSLSYCWGREPQSIPLRLQDGTIFINSNLAAALSCLQRLVIGGDEGDGEGEGEGDEALRVQYIWIDKICIDQSNLSERSSQVGLMGHVYSQSIRTLIWLGLDTGECAGAWRLIHDIYDVCMNQNASVQSIADIPLRLYSEDHHAESGLPDLAHEHWRSLTTLLSDPWFTRIWVIQEVVLSNEDPIILHGQHCYAWHHLGWAASWMRRNGFFRLPQFPEALRNVDEISNIRRSPGKWPLDALLSATSVKFRATDQRDKVYGLIGIAAEAHDPLNRPTQLQPDYSLSVEQVYLRTARYLLQATKSLAVIIRTRYSSIDTCPSQHTYNLTRLPTWVPDWSDFNVSERDVMKTFSWLAYSQTAEPVALGFPTHYAASAGHPAIVRPSADEDILRLTGIRIDIISHSIPFNVPSQSTKDFIENFATISSRVLECLAPLLTKEDVMAWVEDYVRTTTAEQHHLSGRTFELLLKDGAAFLIELLSSSDTLRSSFNLDSSKSDVMSLLGHLSQGGSASSYAALAQNYCHGRSLVVTSGQKIGLAPASARSGDFVCVLYGGGIPYILRRHEYGWFFIGDSYFPNLSRGEAIHAQKSGEMREEEFYIQ